jgi:hypothetical protein
MKKQVQVPYDLLVSLFNTLMSLKLAHEHMFAQLYRLD